MNQEAEAHLRRGLVLGFEGIYESGLAELETAVRLEPENLRYLNCLALSYTMLGMYDEARPLFERIIVLAPNSKEAVEARRQLRCFEEFGV